MIPSDKVDSVIKLLQSHPSLFRPDDLHPLTLPDPPPRPYPSVTPFQSKTQWTASSTLAVLDALPISQKAQVESLPQLPLEIARSTGATTISPDMADLFDSSDEHVLICLECRRPILRTRFVAHVSTCGKGTTCRTDDSEMALVIAPYGLVDQPAKPNERVSMVNIRRGGGSKRRIPLEEETWERDLDTLSTPYVPRAKSRKRRRVALSADTTTSGVGQRKRSVERKAMQVAMQAGVTWSGPGVEPLRALATKWGGRAPWAKLMQIAMPVVVARTPKRRKEDGVLMVRGLGKVDIPERPAPSLVGSLMYLRGLGMRELANTALGSIDSPQAVTGRTGAVFHGQTYIAELGTFETDPRALTTIKMPSAVAAEVITKPVPKKAAAVKAGSTGSSGGPGSGTKKQKVPKGQRGGTNQQAQGGAHGPAKVSTPRKSGGSRAAAAAAGNAKGGASSQDSQQPRANVGRNAAGMGASAALSSGSAATMTKFASPQHPVPSQKKGYRQSMSAGMGAGAMPRVGSAQSLPSGSMAGGVPLTGNMRGGNKARQMPTSMGSTPVSGARQPGGAKITKSPSPSQASSRSGERLTMHRGSPMSAAMYDPNTLVSPVGQVPPSVNRTAGIRASQPKTHLDLQQVMAQVTGQGGLIPGAAMGNNNAARAAMQQAVSKGFSDKIGGQMARVQNMRGMAPQARVKPNAIPQNVQARLAAAHKRQQPRQQPGLGQLRKEDRDLLQKAAPDLEAQLRRTDNAVPAELITGKPEKASHSMMFGKQPDRRNVAMNPALQGNAGFFSGALDAVTSPMGGNVTLNANQQQQQASLAFMRMAHQNHLNPAGAANPAAAQNMIQNLHDIRSLQNMGMVPGLQQNATRNASMLNFLQATGLAAGGANTGAMASPGMGGIAGSGMPAAPNPMMGQEAILQQLLSGQAALAPNAAAAAALHGQHLGAQTGAMNQGHQVGRTGGMAPMAAGGPAVVQPSKKADLDEIDRALELSFDESDLMD